MTSAGRAEGPWERILLAVSAKAQPRRPILPFGGLCLSLKAVLDSTSFQLDGRPPGDLCSKAINFLLRAFSLGARALTFAILPTPRIDTFPFESDSGTMRKVLNWGVVPLNLKWQGMVVHGLCWARINSPENIRRFNSTKITHTTRI